MTPATPPPLAVSNIPTLALGMGRHLLITGRPWGQVISPVLLCDNKYEVSGWTPVLLAMGRQLEYSMASRIELPPRSDNCKPTSILDYDSPDFGELFKALDSSQSKRGLLQQAHQLLKRELRPVYTVTELQPASRTFQLRQGSCSQRLACLEAVARAHGVPTRVQAFRIDGRFWYPRFRWMRMFLPSSVLLVWPQFWLEERWVPADELYSSTEAMIRACAKPFSNTAETLFETIGSTIVDFTGRACELGHSEASLNRFLREDLGVFNTRDNVFDRFGSLEQHLMGKVFNMFYQGKTSAEWCGNASSRVRAKLPLPNMSPPEK